MSKNWREEMTTVSILYLLSIGKKIPTDTSLVVDELSLEEERDVAFLKETMKGIYNDGLVEIEGAFWALNSKGREVLAKIVKMFDHVLQFEIFGGVRLKRNLTEDECQEDDKNMVLDYIYDPRFLGPDEADEESEDLRVAMLSFLVDQDGSSSLDPRRVIFIQKLIDKELRSDSFFFDLLSGKFFEEVDEIAASAYQWRDIGATEEESISVMQTLYTVGMLEQRKRDGQECSECHIPLAVFELIAKEDGETLTACPNPDCGADYQPQTVTVMEDVVEPAEYEEVIEEIEEPVWVGGYDYYGYEPYGYYDPWNPIGDAAFLCLCVALW